METNKNKSGAEQITPVSSIQRNDTNSKRFMRSLYSSKAMFSFKSIALPFSIFLIVIGGIISSMSPLIPLWNAPYSSIVYNHPDLENAMVEVLDSNLDCVISAQNKDITCNNWADFTVTKYDVLFKEEGFQFSELDKSAIIFSKNSFNVVTIVSDDEKYHFAGQLNTLSKDLDFKEFYADNNAKEDKETIYKGMVKNMIRGIYLSTVPEKSLIIISSNMVNYFVTVFIIAILFLMLNYRSPNKAIEPKESIALVSISALWAGFMAALISLYNQTLGSIAFFTILSLKAVFIYVYILKKKKVMGLSGM